MSKSAIVIGAGIVGLAAARALALRDYRVTVLERNHRAMGASVRNFGMIWPVGQPDGELYERALLSGNIWKETCNESGIWYEETGSLHLAYHPDEWDVLEELQEQYRHRNYRLLTPAEVRQQSPVAAQKNLLGALFSPHEMIIDPRAAIAAFPGWLEEKYGVKFVWGCTATAIHHPVVVAGDDQFSADRIFVCSGADFETLYPALFAVQPLTKCKLQMMRMAPQPNRIGPALCGGLSLVHYQSFKVAASLSKLQLRYDEQYPEYIKEGIHVMVAQNQSGELTIGDSHTYGLTPDPFDRQAINQLILDYLQTMTCIERPQLTETWHGIYPKLTNGGTELLLYPENGVIIINGLGGAGMTLSFGLCSQLLSRTG